MDWHNQHNKLNSNNRAAQPQTFDIKESSKMLQNGITRKIGGVLFLGTSDLTATAHSENDSQSENPVKVKVIGNTITMQNLAGLFRLTAKSWAGAANVLKEEIFNKKDEKIQKRRDLRAEFDALPDNPNGSGKLVEGVVLRLTSDGNFIDAMSAEDTAGKNKRSVEYDGDQLIIHYKDKGFTTASKWEAVVEILVPIFKEYNDEKQAEQDLRTAFGELPTP